jgi:thioredoxin reductase
MSEHEVVVIGGGAAGLSAALVLTRALRSVAVVDAGEPRNAPAAHLHGYLSRDGLPPQELLAAGRAEVRRYGGQLIDGRVTGLEPTPAGLEVLLQDGRRLTARRVLVTTGLRDELPAIPGVRERWGRDLLHCPYCHGFEVRDGAVAVLGGSPEAVQHALLVRQWASDLLLLPHDDELAPADREALAARGIGVVEGSIARLVVEDDRLTGIALGDGRVVARTAAFVRPRFVPSSELLLALRCATDARGSVVVDPTGRTSLPGVWAAGNVVNPRAQLITAAGEGSAAAIALNADLVEEDVRLAVDALSTAPATSPRTVKETTR